MTVFSWFAKVVASVEHFLSGAVKAAPGIIVDIERAAETAAQVSCNVVNQLKTWASSPQGQLVEDVISTVVPAQWITKVLDFLPKIITDLGWAKAEFTKSPQDVLKDGLQYALNNPNSDVVKTNLATLAAHVNTFVGDIQGVTIPVQASLSQAHVVYLGLPDGNEATAQAEAPATPDNVHSMTSPDAVVEMQSPPLIDVRNPNPAVTGPPPAPEG